jgi:hypothetical protein
MKNSTYNQAVQISVLNLLWLTKFHEFQKQNARRFP